MLCKNYCRLCRGGGGGSLCEEFSVLGGGQPLFDLWAVRTVMMPSARLPRFFGPPLHFFFFSNNPKRNFTEDKACPFALF